MISAIQIGKALEQAAFPIRSHEELHTALRYHLKVDERCKEGVIESMVNLFSPRDFLFTNAEQIQRIVKARQCVLVDEDNDIHYDD